MAIAKLRFTLLSGNFAVCRLPADVLIPDGILRSQPFVSVTRTADELSIACREESVPPDAKAERDWKCFKLEGPISFSQTGILASFIQPLAESAIPVFAVSTYDTDYVLVKEGWAGKALLALKEAGHTLVA
ncbi:MAG TPA: ACT domain-containing protein [Terriglobales bacterium]